MVGAVLVHNQRVVAEGFHRAHKQPHAEHEAISALQNKGLLSQCTLYVSLEPCAHHGHTPPCADLIVESGIKHVVVAALDPNPLVAGKGINKLRQAGVLVETGVLETDARGLNCRFFNQHENHRPYVVLKWAQTADSFIDSRRTPEQRPLKITGAEADQLHHQWRTEEHAILVGTNTAILDNPWLTARLWPGPQPIRILIDRRLRVPTSAHMLAYGAVVLTTSEPPITSAIRYHRLDKLDSAADVLRAIHALQIQSVLVEGGADTLGRFIEEELWDEARVFASAQRIGDGIKAPRLLGNLVSSQAIGSERLDIYRRP